MADRVRAADSSSANSTETLVDATGERCRLDDDERSPPSGPQVTEPRPEQPVNGPQPRAPAGLSLQDRSLMTKRRVLNLERRLALQA